MVPKLLTVSFAPIIPLQELLPIASLLPFSLFCHAVVVYLIRGTIVSRSSPILENSRQRVLLSDFHHFNDGLVFPKMSRE